MLERTRPSTSWLLTALILLMGAALLFPLGRWLANEWWTNDYYSHGVLVPLVSGFFAWRIIPRLERGGDNRGLLLVGLGVGLYLYFFAYRAFHLTALAVILMLTGIVWTYWGWQGVKQMAFSLAFLLFMIPFPFVEASSLPLSLFTGQLATRLMQALGMDVTVQGAAVTLPNANLVVGAQCSGVRSIISLAALTAIFAYLVEGAWWRKALLFLAVIPIAVLGNIFRVSSLLWVADKWGADAGFTYYHDYSGFAFFAFAFILLILTARLLRCHRIRNDL
ncbi:MAG TPA: exosortase/archaeosortase family protein [Anaerolineae bacterium]|nr:exosortase/archaeosortase family protein [Anaerolineae bacterium]